MGAEFVSWSESLDQKTCPGWGGVPGLGDIPLSGGRVRPLLTNTPVGLRGPYNG